MPAVTNACRAKLLVPIAGLLLLAGAPVALASTASTGGVEAGAPATPAAPAAPAATTPAATTAAPTSGLPGPSAVQRALGIPVTHQWDHATRQAIRAFQRAHGLAPDGIVGPKTAAALGLTTTATDASSTGASSRSAATTAELARIARCESGDNPTAVSPDGRYRGKYQFTMATWHSVGGHGDPAKASAAQQDERAAMLLARDGTADWPTCG
jgi:hypothetical protein